MEIENLLDELEDLLESSWKMPMSGGKAFVNTSEIKRILEDINLKLPKEIVQAKKIVTDRAKIIENAEREIDSMFKVAEEKIKQMVTREEVVKAAQNTANEIISEAKSASKEMRAASNDYAENVMAHLDKTLTSYLAEVRKSKQVLKGSEINIG